MCLPVKELNYSEGGWVCLGGRHPVKPTLPYMDEMMVFVCLRQNKKTVHKLKYSIFKTTIKTSDAQILP